MLTDEVMKAADLPERYRESAVLVDLHKPSFGVAIMFPPHTAEEHDRLFYPRGEGVPHVMDEEGLQEPSPEYYFQYKTRRLVLPIWTEPFKDDDEEPRQIGTMEAEQCVQCLKILFNGCRHEQQRPLEDAPGLWCLACGADISEFNDHGI